MIQTTGYDMKSFASNVALGVIDGLDGILWAYVFSTIIFSSVLSVFLPVGLFVILLGWALASLFVILRSSLPTHMVALDEQSVVIIGSISILLVADLGDKANSPEGLATILAVMSVSSLAAGIGLYLMARLNIARLLELIPFPVVCGFASAIAWLLLEAGILIATGADISGALIGALQEGNNLLRLVLCIAGGAFLIWFSGLSKKAWGLPVAALAIIVAFYAVAAVIGETKESLVVGGWLFDIDSKKDGAIQMLASLSFADVNIGFIVSVIPQIATIVFLVLLSAAIGLSTLAATDLRSRIQPNKELKNLSGGNFLCALVCSPPGFTDAVSCTIFEKFGASSRWMPITSSVLLLAIIPLGVGLITYMPVVLVGSMVFLFVIQMFYDWMYQNVREFGKGDYLIVVLILLVVIAVGVVEGIVTGILLTALLFVFRYSLISAIRRKYTLRECRSSVERPAASNLTLNRHGGEALMFNLSGFLFFGTTNAIRYAIRDSIKQGTYTTILLDFRRVTGIDISALQTIQKIKLLCESEGIDLLYSCLPDGVLEKLLSLDAVSWRNGKSLAFPTSDIAIEQIEEMILAKYPGETTSGSVQHYLTDILKSDDKARLVAELMDRVEIASGEHLFRQGALDNGFFMLVHGVMTAVIDDGHGGSLRVKKFLPGSIIGELSSYTAEAQRTATVVADKPSVLYHLDAARLTATSPGNPEITSAIHEIVAKTLSARIEYMNRRLINEMT